MSAVAPPPPTPGTFLCPRCGTTLGADQAWCLECGLAARTRVHPPPSWRGPVIVTALVLALLAAGITLGLVALLDKPQPTPAATTVVVPATTAATPTPPTTTPTTATGPAATTPAATTPTTTTVPPATTPTRTAPGTVSPRSPTISPTPTIPHSGLISPSGSR